MKGRNLISIVIVALGSSCVDRLYTDIPLGESYPVTINGSITNQPGPYYVEVTRGFDPQGATDARINPITVEKLTIFDDHGNSEDLVGEDNGRYRTSPTGIQGTIGYVYTMRAVLYDGRTFESLPDTLLPPGNLENTYAQFKAETNAQGITETGFDIFIDASAGNAGTRRFLWKVGMTFKGETHPELRNIQFDAVPCVNGFCNFYDECSGIKNIGTNNGGFNPLFTGPTAEFVRVKPCECCICWYTLFNSHPILSDDELAIGDNFPSIKAHYIPLDGWIFKQQVYITTSQYSMTRQSFAFWKSIKDQQDATSSLFQPVTGKIKTNLRQTEGKQSLVEGLFFAASLSSKRFMLSEADVPKPYTVPEDGTTVNSHSCLEKYPNATTVKPAFWVD